MESGENTNRLAAADHRFAAVPASAQKLPASAQKLPARLIVCERTGRWALTLRRELAEAGVRVWETRTVADCWRELAESPASFVVVELAGELSGLLHRMARQPREFPMARLAVVADRALAGHQWLMREAGAVHFLCSPRKVGLLAQLVCRHLAQTPPLHQSLTDRIWANLPWAERRGTRGGGRGSGS